MPEWYAFECVAHRSEPPEARKSSGFPAADATQWQVVLGRIDVSDRWQTRRACVLSPLSKTGAFLASGCGAQHSPWDSQLLREIHRLRRALSGESVRHRAFVPRSRALMYPSASSAPGQRTTRQRGARVSAAMALLYPRLGADSLSKGTDRGRDWGHPVSLSDAIGKACLSLSLSLPVPDIVVMIQVPRRAVAHSKATPKPFAAATHARADGTEVDTRIARPIPGGLGHALPAPLRCLIPHAAEPRRRPVGGSSGSKSSAAFLGLAARHAGSVTGAPRACRACW